MQDTYKIEYRDHTIHCDVNYTSDGGSMSLSTIVGFETHRLNIEENVDNYHVRFAGYVGMYDTLKEALDDVMRELKKHIDNHISSQIMFTTCAIEALDELGFVRVE